MNRLPAPLSFDRTRTRARARPLLRLFTALLVVIGALLLAPAAQAQLPSQESAAATLDEYAAALQSARTLLASADTEEAAALAAARAALQPFRQVMLPSGAQIDLLPLLGEANQPMSLRTGLDRVETALAQLQAAADDATADRLAVLASVLAEPQFVGGELWWEQFLRWLSQWLEGILPDAPNSAGSAPLTQRAGEFVWSGIGIAGAIVLVLLLGYWLRGFLGNFIGSAEAAAVNAGVDDLPLTPADARRRASGLAASGDYRNAVRNLYLSALLTLEQNGLVPHDRSLTNREVLRRMSAKHPVHGRLEPVVDTFDDVWYGVHEPDDQTYRSYTQAIDDLETLAQHPLQDGPP